MNFILSILTLIFCSQLLAQTNAKPSFDEVVQGDQVVLGEIEAGYGALQLVKVMTENDVKASYDKLIELGYITITVQKLPAGSNNTTKINKYTFNAVRSERRGNRIFVVARFTVETFQTFNPSRPHWPTTYKLGEIEYLE